MRRSMRRGRVRAAAVAILTVAVWFASFALPSTVSPAHAAPQSCDSGGGDPEDERRLEEATSQRQKFQKGLQKVLNDGEVLKAGIQKTRREHKALVKRQRQIDRQAGAAHSELAERVRRSYMFNNADPVLSVLSATDASSVVEQSRVLGLLAQGSQEHVERAVNAARRNEAATKQAEEVRRELEQMQRDYGDVKARAEKLLTQAKEQEARLGAKVALQRAANGSGCPLPPGAVSGGLACPVDQPRSYADTWGAPRSGGRSHMGVDILSPYGTALRAYESGVITRMHSNSLGGISLYLRGDSGNEYYYTHLSGYVSGLSSGQRVSAGQHIAFNGDSGNAAGIPHLHWEVRPGGDGNVNPYPYAYAACG
jgi:murein DD-endopeptidase MepM/ murein hydrolase activator NlpD